MGRFTKIAVCAVAGIALCCGSASTSKAAVAKANRIRISYELPKNPDHRPVYEILKEARVLEKMQLFLSPLRLPRALLLKLEGCDGVSNAWYQDGAVTVCYEYLDDVWKNAHKETRLAGVTVRSALLGPLYDVFLHEVGHALFDLLKIPIFGREEDAADAVSAYVMLQFDKEESRELLAGTAYSYAVDVAADHELADVKELGTVEVKQKLSRFAGKHGTPAQRLYNVICIAYGADPELFADVAEKGLLPKKRADHCVYEYEQIAYAYQKLIAPHMDPKLAKKVRARKWLRPTMSPPPYRSVTVPSKNP